MKKEIKEEKEENDRMAVTLWIEKSTVKRLDVLAEKGSLTRSKLLTNLVEASLEELEAMDKMGVLATVIVLRDFVENIRSWREGTKKKTSRHLVHA